MPILPLDHPDPFAATLGVMLYPGADDDPPKARTFASQWLGGPIRRLHEDGHKLSYDVLLRIATDAGRPLADFDDRWWGGSTTGELFKALFALSNTNPALASWNNAVRIAELTATRAKASGSRSALWDARRRFLSVAHLWGAWSIREGSFGTRPEVGYDGYADCQSFLTEAEILRHWGQTKRPPPKGSKPFLPACVWHVPENWEPPTRRPGWPETGKVPVLTLPEDLLLGAGLKPAGRPRTAG
jgi:hypothetical protein